MQNKGVFIYVGQPDMSYTLASKRDYGLKREPQIGFAYLAAVLRQREFNSEILDFTLKRFNFDSLNYYIEKEKPLFVGFYACAAIKDYVIDFIRSVRKKFPDLKILLGGPDMYDCEDYLKAGGDVYCLGEGEETIIELVQYCQEKKDLAEIKGIVYIKNGQIRYTPKRELIKNLNELPIPAWDKYDLNSYYDYHVFDMVQPYASIMAARGCPFRCTYCISHKFWGNIYRRRSVNNVLKEIDLLVEKQGVRYVMFQDDIWSWNDDNWAKEFCHKLIAKPYKIKWRCILHPFSFRHSREEILPLMKRAGCSSVSIGLQSASKQILKNINRSPEQPEVLAGLLVELKKIKILHNIELIFGLPGDTEETIEESIQFALKNKPTFAAFYALTVLAGSDICLDQKAGKFHSLPDDFVKGKCKDASRRFYTNPGVIYNTCKSILQTNPRWFLKAAGHAKYILQLAGIFKKKK